MAADPLPTRARRGGDYGDDRRSGVDMTDNERSTGDVGSLGEEAAKLLAAAAAWAREHAGEATGPAAAAGSGAGALLGDLLSADHIATGAPECKWCPVCQAISMLRSTSPEVRDHLG